MKTLKRTLCLVLALALSFSVVAGAASYDTYADKADVAASKYAEAADVVLGLGIIKGVSGNKVDLEGTLTRAMAAKILTYLLIGEETAEALAASDTSFSDVAAADWESKYVAYAASKGILVGSNGKFSPDAPVTGYALAKMILNAMGYGYTTLNYVDATTGELKTAVRNNYEGDFWTTNISVDANKIGLFADLKDVDLNKALTRGQAMQMVFNALEIDALEDAEGTDDPVYDVPAYAIAKNELATAGDVCGRTGYNWYVDADKSGSAASTEIITANYVAAPAYTFTATTTIDADDELVDAANTALGLKDDAALTDDFSTVTYNGAAGFTLGVAGAKYLAGDVIELYTDAATGKKIEKVVAIRYDLIKIDDVDTKNLDAEEIKAGNTAKIDFTIYGGATKVDVLTNDFAGFDYAKDTYVLAALKGNTVIASKAATIVSGKVTSTKGDASCINGTYYETQAGTALTIGEEYTYALNEVGKLEGLISAPTTSGNYALIYAIEKKTADDAVNADGVYVKGATSYIAYTVLADGTKAAYTLATVEKDYAAGGDKTTYVKGAEDMVLATGTGEGKTAYSYAADGDIEVLELVVPYVINAKGQLEVTNAPANVTVNDADDNPAINKDSLTVDGAYLTNATKFIFVSAGENNTKLVTTTVGYKELNVTTGGRMVVVANAKGEAELVYILKAAEGATITGTLAVLLDATPVVTMVGEDDYYTYSVAVDGVATTITSKGEAVDMSDVDAGGVFTYTTTNGLITAVKKATFAELNAEVTYIGDDYIYAGEKLGTTGVTLYTITEDQTGASYVYTAVKGGTLAVDDATTLSVDEASYIFALDTNNDTVKDTFFIKAVVTE